MMSTRTHGWTQQRTLAIVLAAACAVGAALWWSSSRPSAVSAQPEAPAAIAAQSEATELAPVVDTERAAPDELAAEAPEPAAEVTAGATGASAELAEPPPAPVEKPDLEARDTLVIRVVDERLQPVVEAEVTLRGLRSEHERAAWHEFRGEVPIAKTDFNGRAELPYWRWVDLDGRTLQVDIVVTHPDFVLFHDGSFEVGPGESEIVLRRGATVVVSGWIGSPNRIVTDLKIYTDRESRLSSGAWQRERDGRLSTTRCSPGRHWLRLEHESAALGLCYSETVVFELAEDEWKELEIELFAAETLTGQLDALVPRPIVDGHLMISVQSADLGVGDPPMARGFECDIAADGTFELARLPRGRGQLFALCRGWVSKRASVDYLNDAGIHITPAPTRELEAELLQRLGDIASPWPSIVIPPPPGPLVIEMERTGVIELTVKLSNGSALADATVAASPNVALIGVGSMIVPWCEWTAQTDGSGLARIEDLPPDGNLCIAAWHASYQMNERDRQQRVSVAVRSGETTRAEIVLEPKQP